MATLYQFNTLASLMNGLYEGIWPLSDLSKYGNFGIGTFDSIDGEMIILDGKIYQARGDNTVSQPDLANKTPYTAIVDFQPTISFNLTGLDEVATSDVITSKMISQNLFHAIQIKGQFSNLGVRMAPKTQAGIPFAEAYARQPEYSQVASSGTVVGFYTPLLFNGAATGGYHLHYISDDKTFGGHITTFDVVTAQADLMSINKYEQNFPADNQDYLQADFDLERIQKMIEEVE